MLSKIRTRASLAFQPSGRVTMYDSIYPGNLPGGAGAYAGYVNGAWPTWSTLVSQHEASGAKLLSIDVFGNGFAHCLDVENGDATNAQIISWYNRMKAAGVPCPVIYTSASNIQGVLDTFTNAGITDRTKFLVWSAHYTFSSHICAPSVCGYPAADATQWSDAGPNNCDVSAMSSYFFPWTLGQTSPTPPPVNAPQPYPAPTSVGQDHTQYALNWNPLVVDGKLILDYTVQVQQLNGVVQSTQTVNQPEATVTGLTPGWKYKVLVWANGGPVAPPHAELDITA